MNKHQKITHSTQINDIVVLALNEDIGTGDVSSSLLDNKIISAQIITREAGVFCGVEYAQCAFLSIDEAIKIDWYVSDGDKIKENQILCSISGSAKSILSAERVALNFLQFLSAVATQTNFLVEQISHTKVKLLDTRKTIPGLRLAQKYAVQCGGGVNHRMGLYDCVMLKENHIFSAKSIYAVVNQAIEKYPKLPLIVEVETINQLQQTLLLKGISRILCDNFSIEELILATKLAKNIIPLEASGNVKQDNIVAIAQTGIDYISIGAITKNIRAIDLSLCFS